MSFIQIYTHVSKVLCSFDSNTESSIGGRHVRHATALTFFNFFLAFWHFKANARLVLELINL